MTIIAMRMGNWTHLTDIDACEEEWKYRYHWLREHGEVGYSECIRLIPLIAQGTRFRSWGCCHQSSTLGRSSEISLTCNGCLNCLPQTVQAAIGRLVGLPDSAWSDGKTRLFQTMLSWQHRWADLQWLSTIGLLPLPPNSFPSNV